MVCGAGLTRFPEPVFVFEGAVVVRGEESGAVCIVDGSRARDDLREVRSEVVGSQADGGSEGQGVECRGSGVGSQERGARGGE